MVVLLASFAQFSYAKTSQKSVFTTDDLNGNVDKIYIDGSNGDDTDLAVAMQVYTDGKALIVNSTLTVMVDGNLGESSKLVTCEAAAK